MTYILATARKGVSTILADSRATDPENHKRSHDDAAKIGILFPGCIYGAAGSTEGPYQFLSDFQASGVSEGQSQRANWEYFKKYAEGYVSSGHFRVVFSERTAGSPKLHLYDSKHRKVIPQGDLVTLGSGMKHFDAYIGAWIDAHLEDVEKRLLSEYGNTHLFPNFICLRLIERVQGEERDYFRRQDVGIGGVFHYFVQDHQIEKPQVPSVYLIVWRGRDRERKHLQIEPFRLCGTELGLATQGMPPFHVLPSVHLDMSKRSTIRRLMKEGRGVLIQEILLQLNQLPYYNFLGICFAEEKYRGQLLVHTTFLKEYVFDGKTLDHSFRKKLDEIFTGVDFPDGSVSPQLR